MTVSAKFTDESVKFPLENHSLKHDGWNKLLLVKKFADVALLLHDTWFHVLTIADVLLIVNLSLWKRIKIISIGFFLCICQYLILFFYKIQMILTDRFHGFKLSFWWKVNNFVTFFTFYKWLLWGLFMLKIIENIVINFILIRFY